MNPESTEIRENPFQDSPMVEMLTEEAVNSIFFAAAITLPLVGILLAVLKVRGILRLSNGVIVLITAAGPLNLLLWGVYSMVIKYTGLADVRMLIFNAAVFLIMGLLIGFITALMRDFLRR